MALWGGQAGSLLLWAWMLGLMSFLAVYQNRKRNRALMPWVIATMMLNLIFFAVVVAFISNPFEPLPPAMAYSNGAGMNPLLQHVAMLIHPPILYTGFIGFSVPFAFAVAALITGQLGTTWFETTRRWTLTAWFFLGIGLMLGGRWAYEVLGWGGYWAWDPVENASLMPFLAGTAFLHSVMIQEKRGMLRLWNVLLVILAFALLDAEHDVAIHLDEATITVPCEALVFGGGGEGFHGLVVEAEVEDGVHHAGHRVARAGADGDEQRHALGIAELAAHDFLHVGHTSFHLRLQGNRIGFFVRVEIGADFSADAEAWRSNALAEQHWHFWI